jgi:hypothetical protein
MVFLLAKHSFSDTENVDEILDVSTLTPAQKMAGTTKKKDR